MNRSIVPLVLLVLLGVATAGCDLATKQWATDSLSTSRGSSAACVRDARTNRFVPTRMDAAPIAVIPGALDLVYTENCAGAFGMLYGLSTPLRRGILILGNLLAAFMLVSYARGREGRSRVTLAGVALVLGGGFGNLFDRLTRGFVVDFIHAHWHAFDWPVFNVADIAIAVGIGLLLLPVRPGRPAIIEPTPRTA